MQEQQVVVVVVAVAEERDQLALMPFQGKHDEGAPK